MTLTNPVDENFFIKLMEHSSQYTDNSYSQSNDENVNTITCKTFNCKMTLFELTIYEEINSSNKSQNKKNSDINKLYEHPLLVKPIKKATSEMRFTSSGKMIALKKLLKNLKKENKQRIIILSEIALVLDIIKDYYEDHKKYNCLILNGLIRGNKRQETIDAFNSTNDDMIILLMETSSSEGINISSADVLIFYDNEINEKKEAKIIQNSNLKSLYHLILNDKQQTGEESNEYKIKLPFPKKTVNNQDVEFEPKKLDTIHTVFHIPYIKLFDGLPKFPFKINDDLEILSIGNVVTEKGFYTEKYIFPLGYCARRRDVSVTNTNEKAWYLLKVIRDDQFNPIFRIEMENDDSIFFEDSNLFRACSHFNNKIMEYKTIFLSGTEFFGFSIPIVHFIIQNLEGANKISIYHKINYVMKDETKIKKLKFQMGGACLPNLNYMINIDNRIKLIKESYVDLGEYFVINRSRQTGKTTTLLALANYLKSDYFVIFINLEKIFGDTFYSNEDLVKEFLSNFLESYHINNDDPDMKLIDPLQKLFESEEELTFSTFLSTINTICKISPKKFVLIIDEIDKFRKNPNLLIEFLSLLRGQYQQRGIIATFHSVILSGIRDIQQLRSQIRSDEKSNEANSPWNINKAFTINMYFTIDEIISMLEQYESYNFTGMNIDYISKYIYEFTSGHPFLVSTICKYIDEVLSNDGSINNWSKLGVNKSIDFILNTDITFFSDIIEKLKTNDNLKEMLKKIIFKKDKFLSQIIYNEPIRIGKMFGIIKIIEGNVVITNRIIEMLLTYYFISEEKVEDFHHGDLEDRSKYISIT